MARIINRPCTVILGKVGDWREPAPIIFTYQRERHQVGRILDYWREAGRWWEKEPETESWRVQTVKGGVYELVRTPSTGAFVLYKAYD